MGKSATPRELTGLLFSFCLFVCGVFFLLLFVVVVLVLGFFLFVFCFFNRVSGLLFH